MAAKLEWLEADDWQRETLTEFTIGQAEKPHNDIATVWFDAGATVSTTREEAAELARMFTAAPSMLETLQDVRDDLSLIVADHKLGADANVKRAMSRIRTALSRAKGDT